MESMERLRTRKRNPIQIATKAALQQIVHKSPVNRVNAAIVMGFLGTPKAVQGLGMLLRDPNISVRKAAQNALDLIQAKEERKKMKKEKIELH